MKNSVSRTGEIVLGVLGVLSGLIGSFFALFIGGLSDTFKGDSGGFGGLSFAAFIFSITGIISIILIRKNRKLSGWGFVVSGIGTFISIFFAGILPSTLFLIAGIMMLKRKVPEQIESSRNELKTKSSNENINIKKNKKLMMIMGSIVGVILIIGIIGSVFTDGSERESISIHYSIGDFVEVGGLEYTVLSISVAESLENEYMNATAQGIYCIVEVNVKNNDKESRMIDTSLFKLIEEDGTEYTADYTAGDCIEGNGDFFLNSLNPKFQQSGYIVFDVLDPNKFYQLEVSGGMISGKTELISLVNKQR
ncbi:hypothetical protein SH2C18_45260 [Clostridium sediminicola]|uniref:DUF4352 domain-containing protein n=1 Tax=Clostridium sediminicola TaxID=3114879 RepID=UPI0031F1DB5D